ncbi:Rid family detoxifying hydrolase [Candidatus Persebacteraceae bacterium Df01]|jgi:reactive intermediate/imine deaminase|uniref:Rid family detoxifying hydrolase n=1 Tax=Candidatus Doriopsillibacter californiensis TaxID=2970740 RepID=A0ABT7QMQ9_9GAMM|nr:Rid family detoxifying hydrolase [Candidatus Persebacteraceae bacterium Df01]
MNNKTIIQTNTAPQAIGAYSQAVSHGGLVFISGQIPLDPSTGALVEGGAEAQVECVFDNLAAVCEAAGGKLDDIIKLNVYLIDLTDFSVVNATMESRFSRPFPARAAVGVAALPKGARVEAEAIMATSI